jgi:hypothetical protein
VTWDHFDWESSFCPCGVTLMGDPDESDGLCGTCAKAPHGRDCGCDECEAYWADVCERSRIAADEANRALVCTCGWTGPFIEHHRDRKPGCEVTRREAATA